MRSRTRIFTVAAAALLSVGASAVPALAASDGTVPAAGSSASAELRADGQDGMTGMGRMHEQMMKGMPDTAGMQEMMQSVPGMAKMHEQMMTGRPAGQTS